MTTAGVVQDQDLMTPGQDFTLQNFLSSEAG